MNMAQHSLSVLDIPTKALQPLTKASLALALLLLIAVSCSQDPNIYASYETPPVITAEDAADDPAIVINFDNPTDSLIFGTDKKSGVYLYDLEGNELSYAPLGNINNIDVRQLNDQVFVTATNRSIQAIEYWVFNQDDFFNTSNHADIFSTAIRSSTIPSAINIYGICMGLINSVPVAFVTEDMDQVLSYGPLTMLLWLELLIMGESQKVVCLMMKIKFYLSLKKKPMGY
jgi:myo-inositol-hexaphosphate 3-phosphohydrolase